MFDKLLKAAVGVVTLPVDIVADVVTLGGSLTDEEMPYTAQKAANVMKNIQDAVKADES